jgi:hypothetical protein
LPIADLSSLAVSVPIQWSLKLNATTVTLDASVPVEGSNIVGSPKFESATVSFEAGSLVVSIGNRRYNFYLNLRASTDTPVDHPQLILGVDGQSTFFIRTSPGCFLPLHHGLLGGWFISSDKREMMRIDVVLESADTKHIIGYKFKSGQSTFNTLKMYDLLVTDDVADCNDNLVQYCIVSHGGAHPEIPPFILGRHDSALQLAQFEGNTAVVFDSAKEFPAVHTVVDDPSFTTPLVALALGVSPSVQSRLSSSDRNVKNRTALSPRAIQTGVCVGGGMLGAVLGGLMAR